MNKQLPFFLIFFVSLCSHSQIIFEKGYYVDNSNLKIDCLIKNADWENNPLEFEFKLSENDMVSKENIQNTKEFGIYDVSKYVRSKVKIDRSNESIEKLSFDKEPAFVDEELFLNVLVEGKANLYQYKDRNLIRYFYSQGNSNIQQLVYKSYKATNIKIKKNKKYLQQLFTDLNCSSIDMDMIKKVDYNKNELVNFFIYYNGNCSNEEYMNFEEKNFKDFYNLNLRVGLNSSSLIIKNFVDSSRDTDFGTELAFRLGLESEFIMPFNKNKWSIIIEPTYQSFKSENIGTNQSPKVTYKSIEFPIGLRHYLFLN